MVLILFIVAMSVAAGALLSLYSDVRGLRTRVRELEEKQEQTLELVSSLVVDGAGADAVKQTLSSLLRQPRRIP